MMLAGVYAQPADTIKTAHDSTYIASVENKKGPAKLLHAEPLYIDLIRDLGARKGEREWNFGTGITDNLRYDAYTALVEYEWAPVNRLGLEVELPFTFYYRSRLSSTDDKAPGSRLNSLKLAAQYTVLVSEPAKTSVAFGYLHEFELPAFSDYRHGRLLQGHLASPFLVAAKRFGNNWHGLIYTGPLFHYQQQTRHWQTSGQYNWSVHYMLPGTRNFMGLETNMLGIDGRLQTVLRPQMRLSVSDNLLVGIVGGIPLNRSSQRLSSFARIIYEPGHKHRK